MRETFLVLSLLATQSLRALHRLPNPRKGEKVPKKYKPRRELLERLALATGLSEDAVKSILIAERKRILQEYGLFGDKLNY